jgi:hypothetical protein
MAIFTAWRPRTSGGRGRDTVLAEVDRRAGRAAGSRRRITVSQESEAMARLAPVLALGALIILVLPVWRWSRGWGWPPVGILLMGLVTLVLFTFVAIEPD